MQSIRPSGPALAASTSESTSGGRSAAVLEFVCLFTHDLRRKQKRWQDGRLKYHTFNKRVMVYDDRGNFVGDMHWQREWEFDEGEEVQLERGGVIVQVAECVGRENQDLSELLDKRAKEKEQRQARLLMRSSVSVASPQAPTAGPRDHFQTRHRPLHQLIGTPTGHHGRAVVPTESPFELRQRANETPENRTDSRPTKRRKYDDTPPSKMGYAQNLFGATLTLSAVPTSSVPVRRSTSQACRTQPQVSSPPQEAIPDIEPVREKQGLNSSKTRPPASPARTVPEPVDTPPDDRHVSVSTTAALGRTGLEKVVPRPQIATSVAKRVGDRSLGSVRNDQASFRGANPNTASKNPERGTTVQKSPAVIETAQIETGSDHRLDTRPKLGMSRSKAIVLDDDADDRLDEPDKGSKPLRETKKSATSKPLVPSVGRQNVAKRNNLLRPPAEKSNSVEALPEGANAPPDEERTELRLKPRQKRGLLLVSEKKNKTKRPKRQAARPTEPDPIPEFSDPPMEYTTPEPRPHIGAGSTDSWSTPRLDDARQVSPTFPEYGLPEPGPLSPQHEGFQILQRPEATHLSPEAQLSLPIDAVDEEDHETPVDSPRPPQPPPDTTNSSGDELEDLSQSPKRRRISRRTKSAQVQKEPSTTRSPSPDDALTDPVPKTSRSKLPRRACRVDNSDDELPRRPTRPTRKARPARKEDSESEELVQAPIRPHLARLNRKSVRSREVFGFIPSSSPVIDLPDQEEPPAKPLLDIGRPPPMNNMAIPSSDPEDPPNPVLSMFGRTGDLAEKAETPLPSKATIRGPVPAARQNKPPASETVTNEEKEEQKETPTAQHPGDPSSRHGLTRQRSAVLQPANGKNGTPDSAPAPRPPSIAIPTKDTSSATARPRSADQTRLPKAEAPLLPPQLHKSRSLLDQPQHPITDPPDIAPVSRATEGASKHPPADPPTACTARPRITNPASRGRKAALKSDAAGQVPQSILPPVEPPAPMRGAGLRPPVANERPKRKMTFPGFVSAKSGGGPWSREAHDLLESGRPGTTES